MTVPTRPDEGWYPPPYKIPVPLVKVQAAPMREIFGPSWGLNLKRLRAKPPVIDPERRLRATLFASGREVGEVWEYADARRPGTTQCFVRGAVPLAADEKARVEADHDAYVTKAMLPELALPPGPIGTISAVEYLVLLDWSTTPTTLPFAVEDRDCVTVKTGDLARIVGGLRDAGRWGEAIILDGPIRVRKRTAKKRTAR